MTTKQVMDRLDELLVCKRLGDNYMYSDIRIFRIDDGYMSITDAFELCPYAYFNVSRIVSLEHGENGLVIKLLNGESFCVGEVEFKFTKE